MSISNRYTDETINKVGYMLSDGQRMAVKKLMHTNSMDTEYLTGYRSSYSIACDVESGKVETYTNTRKVGLSFQQRVEQLRKQIIADNNARIALLTLKLDSNYKPKHEVKEKIVYKDMLNQKYRSI